MNQVTLSSEAATFKRSPNTDGLHGLPWALYQEPPLGVTLNSLLEVIRDVY